jgi:hypothetical protein
MTTLSLSKDARNRSAEAQLIEALVNGEYKLVEVGSKWGANAIEEVSVRLVPNYPAKPAATQNALDPSMNTWTSDDFELTFKPRDPDEVITHDLIYDMMSELDKRWLGWKTSITISEKNGTVNLNIIESGTDKVIANQEYSIDNYPDGLLTIELAPTILTKLDVDRERALESEYPYIISPTARASPSEPPSETVEDSGTPTSSFSISTSPSDEPDDDD